MGASFRIWERLRRQVGFPISGFLRRQSGIFPLGEIRLLSNGVLVLLGGRRLHPNVVPANAQTRREKPRQLNPVVAVRSLSERRSVVKRRNRRNRNVKSVGRRRRRLSNHQQQSLSGPPPPSPLPPTGVALHVRTHLISLVSRVSLPTK